MAKERNVRYVVWTDDGKKIIKGHLIRAGETVRKTIGRLVADPSPWSLEVARIFKKCPEVEEISIMDRDGNLHSYYRDRP